MEYIFSYINDYSIDDYERAYKSLSDVRKERVDRYKRDDDKKRSLCAQMLLQKLLEKQSLSGKELFYEENGCPKFKNSQLFVSISHSEDVAFCAVSENAIGVDVEKMRKISHSLINRVCVDEEKAYVKADCDINADTKTIGNPDVIKRFFEIWTAKEAYFKMRGSGITDLKMVNTLKLERSIFTHGDYVFCIIEDDCTSKYA